MSMHILAANVDVSQIIGLIVLVVSLVMVLVIAFSGRKTVQGPKPSTTPAMPTILEPSQPRIQEYRTTLDDATRKLAAEEAELAHTKQTMAQESNLPLMAQPFPPFLEESELSLPFPLAI